MTGDELGALDENARRQAAAHVNVFARAAPEHKLQIVRALQASGQLVAMTGDGVNDAPALKAAHIGIAMGAGATDVAREASALVVTNEDFGVIASGILLGRRVFENLRRAVMYIIAVHVPIAASALAPILFGLPGLLFPIHVLFLELVIDPACSIALEAEQPDGRSLAVPPRAAGATLFTRRDVIMSLLQGAALTVAVIGTYVVAGRQLEQAQARATAFVSLVVGNLALILVQRSSTRSAFATLIRSRNLAADLVSVGALFALALALLVPAARELFQFALPPLPALAGAVAVAIAVVLPFDLAKRPRSSKQADFAEQTRR
jgi:Ca2+-transporting ATPase